MPCIEAGYIQKEIHRSAVQYQRAIESGSKKVVGVNTYAEGEGSPEIDLHKIDPGVEREQRERLAKLRRERDAAAVTRELEAVREACGNGDNLLERFVAAAHADCTLGEICAVLRDAFGKYKEPKIL